MKTHYKLATWTETGCGEKWARKVSPLPEEVTCLDCIKHMRHTEDLLDTVNATLEKIRKRLYEGTATAEETRKVLGLGREDV